MNKINHLITILITFSICVTTIVSCNKEETKSSSNLDYEPSSKSSIIDYSLINNTNNPYDFVGFEHNAIMDYIAEKCDIDNLSNYAIFEKVEGYVDSVFNTIGGHSFSEIQSIIGIGNAFTLGIQNGDSSYSTILSNATLAYWMDSVNRILLPMIKESQLYTPSVFAEHIISIEGIILSLNGHSSSFDNMNEYDMVLAALSIARYSYCYWYTVVSDPTHPWYYPIQNNTKEEGNGEADPIDFIEDVAVSFWADVRGFFGDVEVIPAQETVLPSGGTSTSGGIAINVSLKDACNASAAKWKERREKPEGSGNNE